MSRFTMIIRRTTFGALVSAFTAFAPSLPADEPAAPQAVADAVESLDLGDLPIEELARRLDSDSFDERQSASEALAKRGEEATPILEKLATEGTREAKSRALDLLIGRAKSEGESESKTSARAALERLSKSADAYASRRSAEAIAPSPEPTEAPQIAVMPRVQALQIGPQFAPNIRIQQMAPAIRIQAIAQNAGLKIQRSNDNGVETTEAEEGDRKVKVKKTPDGKIEMEIVETKDGKESTEKVAAKDEADLKTNSPKAYELYKKYAGEGGLQAQIIVGNAIQGGFPGGIPAFAPPMQGVPAFPPPAAPANDMRLEMLKRMLENVHRQERMIQEQIDVLEKEMQAKDLPAEAPALPEVPMEEPAEEKPADEAPTPAPENVEREAGSDANGGSDD